MQAASRERPDGVGWACVSRVVVVKTDRAQRAR